MPLNGANASDLCFNVHLASEFALFSSIGILQNMDWSPLKTWGGLYVRPLRDILVL